jgi:hypothetical protein
MLHLKMPSASSSACRSIPNKPCAIDPCNPSWREHELAAEGYIFQRRVSGLIFKSDRRRDNTIRPSGLMQFEITKAMTRSMIASSLLKVVDFLFCFHYVDSRFISSHRLSPRARAFLYCDDVRAPRGQGLSHAAVGANRPPPSPNSTAGSKSRTSSRPSKDSGSRRLTRTVRRRRIFSPKPHSFPDCSIGILRDKAGSRFQAVPNAGLDEIGHRAIVLVGLFFDPPF